MTTESNAPDGAELAVGIAAAPTLLRIEWCLPRSNHTVSQARSLLDATLALLGVADTCRDHLALVITEACANAVRHAHGPHDYRIVITIDRHECVIDVDDQGVGLQPQHVKITDGDRPRPARRNNGNGYGLQIIHALTDRLELRPVQPHGLVVHMRKTLTWKPV
jgi:serine/threonine-protein kinase RsbW